MLGSSNTKLSQTALNYLQSLETSSKALRQQSTSKPNEKPKSPPKSLSGRRNSLSSMISQLRTRNNSASALDSDDDELTSSIGKGSVFREEDEYSEESGENVILDFNFDDLPTAKSILPKGTPGIQVGRKSINEIRELRNSIDQSLQPPPKTPERKPVRSIFKKQESEDIFEQEEIESEHEIKNDFNSSKSSKKSPFKSGIESGSSDLESIDFEEDQKPPRRVSFKKPQSNSSTAKSSGRSASSSATSSSEASSSTTSSTSESSARSSGSVSSSSTLVEQNSENSSREEVYQEEFSEPGSGKSSRSSKSASLSSASSRRSRTELKDAKESSSTSASEQPSNRESEPESSGRRKTRDKEGSKKTSAAESEESVDSGRSSEDAAADKAETRKQILRAAELNRNEENKRRQGKGLVSEESESGGRRRSTIIEIDSRSKAAPLRVDNRLNEPSPADVNPRERSESMLQKSKRRSVSKEVRSPREATRGLLSDQDHSMAEDRSSSSSSSSRRDRRSSKRAKSAPRKHRDQSLESASDGLYSKPRGRNRVIDSGTQTSPKFRDLPTILSYLEEAIGSSSGPCSSNAHELMRYVLNTHLTLIDNINELEWKCLRQWQDHLAELRKKCDGPSTEKLQALIRERAKRWDIEL